jgi:hypothetical protein
MHARLHRSHAAGSRSFAAQLQGPESQLITSYHPNGRWPPYWPCGCYLDADQVGRVHFRKGAVSAPDASRNTLFPRWRHACGLGGFCRSRPNAALRRCPPAIGGPPEPTRRRTRYADLHARLPFSSEVHTMAAFSDHATQPQWARCSRLAGWAAADNENPDVPFAATSAPGNCGCSGCS